MAETPELKQRAADNARTMADLAEETAAILDHAAERGDTERRRATAAWEREVADVERHNAEELASDKPAGERDLRPLPPRPAAAAPAADDR